MRIRYYTIRGWRVAVCLNVVAFLWERWRHRAEYAGSPWPRPWPMRMWNEPYHRHETVLYLGPIAAARIDPWPEDGTL